LTTLKDKHVNVRGSTLRFEFRGKSGKRHSISVDDRRLATIVKHCRDLPGQELFQYVDGGHRRKVDSGDVNDYLKAISGEPFTAKDFRTWSGTVLACAALRDLCAGVASTDPDGSTGAGRAPSKAAINRSVLQAVDAVAGVLGNTRSVCRKSYIHPAVIDSYVDGTLHAICQRSCSSTARRSRSGLSADEAAVVALLRRRAQYARKKVA
jgi:DNA topoisomerase-1